jgi:hypothetical protein
VVSDILYADPLKSKKRVFAFLLNG